MISNIIFDIGGVILHWDIDEMINYFTNEEQEKEFIYNNIYDTDEWCKGGLLDKGVISQYDFIKIIQDKTKHINDSLVEKFILEYYKLYYVKNDVVNLMKLLKEKGYKVYVLSNINDYVVDKIDAKSFLDVIDGYVLSYQVKEIKPYDSIYSILLNKYKLNPRESLFIDDSFENIKTANRLGINGRVVEKNSTEDIIRILKEYKIL